KISLDKLTNWLYDETQKQKETIKEEIVRNLIKRKTKQTLLEACGKNSTVQQTKAVRNKETLKKRKEALEQKKLEDKEALSKSCMPYGRKLVVVADHT
ncbi:26789_t:CDS:2, partial [Gigaspora margarita]